MLTASFRKLRQAERTYPGILKQLRQIEARPETAPCGVIGRTITLAALSTRFRIVRPSDLPK